MGLDMFILKIETPTEDPNMVYNYRELSKKGYDFVSETVIDDPSYMEIKKLAMPFRVSDTMFDYGKIQTDFNTKTKPFLVQNDRGGYDVYEGDTVTGKLTKREVPFYSYQQERVVWAFIAKEVAYWRKDYNMFEVIHNSFEEDGISVNNGIYQVLSTNQINAIQKASSNKGLNLWKYPTETLFYLESY